MRYTKTSCHSRFPKLVMVLALAAGAGVACPVLVLAAQYGNGDDTIQVGYVIVTPVSSSGSGLTAYGTFGQITETGVTQAAILAAPLITYSLLPVSVDLRLARDVGVAIANPSTAVASLTLKLNREDGFTLGQRALELAAGEQTSQFISQLFATIPELRDPLLGALVINSDVPVSVMGLRFCGSNFSTVPLTSMSGHYLVPNREPGVGGVGALVLPQFASGGGWTSEIMLVNAAYSPKTVRVDFFTRDGDRMVTELNSQARSSFVDLTIPARGVLRLARRNADGTTDF